MISPGFLSPLKANMCIECTKKISNVSPKKIFVSIKGVLILYYFFFSECENNISSKNDNKKTSMYERAADIILQSCG